MFKKRSTKQIVLVLSLIVLLTLTVSTTLNHVSTKTNSTINTFPPHNVPTSDVVITKNIEHPYGNDYVVPETVSFDFQANFGKLYANTTLKTSVGNILADENGTIAFSLKEKSAFTVMDIDVGTKVTVAERQIDGNGFTIKDGAYIKEGTVTENSSLTIDYVNVYAPKSVNADNVKVLGTKKLNGRYWKNGDSFSFTIERKTDGENWTKLKTKTIAYDGSSANYNKFDFNDILKSLKFDKIGVYDFRISEIEGKLSNIKYDTTIFNFSFHVTDVDMDGKLEIGNVTADKDNLVNYENGNYTLSFEFSNTFIPHVPDINKAEVEIKVNKVVKNIGKESIGRAGFEFVLTDTATGERMIQYTTSDGVATYILSFGLNDVGKSFRYTISETDKGVDGMTYDKSVYYVLVEITLGADNKPTATVKLNGEQVDDAVARFENVYNCDENEAPPTGNKTDVVRCTVMAVVSGICVAILTFKRKKNDKKA